MFITSPCDFRPYEIDITVLDHIWIISAIGLPSGHRIIDDIKADVRRIDIYIYDKKLIKKYDKNW